jgi:hypothetical protein
LSITCSCFLSLSVSVIRGGLRVALFYVVSRARVQSVLISYSQMIRMGKNITADATEMHAADGGATHPVIDALQDSPQRHEGTKGICEKQSQYGPAFLPSLFRNCLKSPGGTSDNSPAINRWDSLASKIGSPVGTAEHAVTFSRPYGTRVLHGISPAINRWAIVARPYGTDALALLKQLLTTYHSASTLLVPVCLCVESCQSHSGFKLSTIFSLMRTIK